MNSTLTIRAQTLGNSFAGDPEFSLPKRPRLIRELLVLPFGQSSLLFEGTRDSQVLAGRSARTFIPELLPHLNGENTLEMLQARFGHLPQRAVYDAIVLLYTRGLLEDGPAEPIAPELTDLAAFAGRYIDVTRVNAAREQVLKRLAAARVAVVDCPAGLQVAQALSHHNLGKLELVSDPRALHANTFDYVVGMFSGDAPEAHEWFAAAHAAGIRTLHAHAGAARVEIGPFIIPGVSGCYECFRELEPEAPEGVPSDLAFWAGVVAMHIANAITRLGPLKLYNSCRIHTRTEQGPTFKKAVLARLPGCKSCGLEDAGPQRGHPDVRAWVLHQAAHVMTCKELRSPRDHQIHYAASNLELTAKAPRPRFGAPRVELPQLEPLHQVPIWTAPATSRERADIALLGQMLHHAAGYQTIGTGVRRIAASGGGLCSCDLYVVSRHVEGLAPGVYHYFGHGHLLERVGAVEDALLAGCLGITEAQLPPLLIVGTSDMRKTRQKYDEFSFRIGVLDAGVARQYLQEIADAAGLEVNEYADMRDKVMAHALNLATVGNRHMLTFAVGIGAIRIEGEPPDPLLHHYQSPDALIEMCSRMGPSVVREDAPAPLTVAPHATRSLGELMLARRSHRRFGARVVPMSVLRSIAAIAADAEARRRCTSGVAVNLTLWIVAATGDGTRTAYRWDAPSAELIAIREGITREEILSTMQQHGYADAPVTLFVTGNFEDALRRLGPRGYREIVSRSSSMLARAQLSAGAWNVVGSMWGGLAEEGVGRLLNLDRYRNCPLFAASLGYAADM